MRCHFSFILYNRVKLRKPIYKPPSPSISSWKFNVHFLLSKNTKSTSKGNKNKLVTCLYLYIYIYIYIYIWYYDNLITPSFPTSPAEFLAFLISDDGEVRYQKGKKPRVRGCNPQPPNVSPPSRPFEKYKPMDLFSEFYGQTKVTRSFLRSCNF